VQRDHTSLAGYRETAWDRLLARAAQDLLPNPCSEEGWLRRDHRDLAALPDWRLRREARILSAFLETHAAQRSLYLPWFTQRLHAVRDELARRWHARRGGRP